MVVVELINRLRKCFNNDRICLFYHGNFDDDFIDKILSLSDQDINKRSKNKMAFLMVECFQNIVRHGKPKLEEPPSSVFGVRRVDPFIYIFSSNRVDEDVRYLLEEKLSKLRGMDGDKLKEYYRELLDNSEISEKGGAGLGLIQMTRKSGRELQFGFAEKDNHRHAFNIQIDLMLDEEASNPTPIKIEENTAYYDLIIQNKVVLFMKTDFKDALISPLLSMLKENTSTDQLTGYLIYHTAVEMIQNIFRHAKVMGEIKDGLFCLIEKESGYFLYTGNYIEEDSDVAQTLDRINGMSVNELNDAYRANLRESVRNNSSNAKVALIDMRRCVRNTIEYKIEEDDLGTYLVMGIEIRKHNG